MISRRVPWIRLFALLAGSVAAVQMFMAADSRAALEEGGGALTGPLINLALAGGATLLLGAVTQLWLHRVGLAASLLGFALAAPFLSWLSVPGLWCSAAISCSASQPPFHLDAYSLASTILALGSIGLQARRQVGRG